MKLVLLSDVHLTEKNPVARLDDLTEVQFDKLKFVFDWAALNFAKILQAGDLFHRPRSWTLLPKVMDAITRYPNRDMYCVFGQHDTYFYSGKTRESTSLGILNKAHHVTILGEEPIHIDQGVKIYGASWGEEIPEPKDESITNILVIHAPISTEPLFPNHEYTSAKRFFEKHHYYDLILCGDIHRKFQIRGDNRYLINTGPMLRMTADEYNFSHQPSFAVYDTNKKTIEWITIPHLDVSEVLTRAHIERKEIGVEMLQEFVDSLKQSYNIQGVNLNQNILKYLKENPQPKEVVKIISEVMADGE